MHAWDMRPTLACLQGGSSTAPSRGYISRRTATMNLGLDWVRERGDIDAVRLAGSRSDFRHFFLQDQRHVRDRPRGSDGHQCCDRARGGARARRDAGHGRPIPPNTTCLKGVPYRILRRSEIAYRGWVAHSSRTAVAGAANGAPDYQTENGERTARARDTRAFTR